MSRKKKITSPSGSRDQAQKAALERFEPLLAVEDFRTMLQDLAAPLPTAFRTNPLKTRPGAELEWADRYGWQLDPVPFCPTGYWVTQTREPVSVTLEHRLGHYYIQDAASMLPVELFDLEDSEHQLVLDLAASPGGKTTHLSARLRDRSLIIANDSAADRLTALRLVLQTWGSTNIAVTRFPGEKFGRWYPETFDRVLLDAPCSMQSLRSTDSHPMRSISQREQEGLAKRQVSLLKAAVAALRPGGQVVYSTCTLAPEENEAVLDEVIRHFGSAVQILNLESRLPAPAPALKEAFGRSFHPQVSRAARLWPHRFHTSGFFAALIQKVSPVAFALEDPPDRPLSLVGQVPLGTAGEKELYAFFTDQYGHNLDSILAQYHLQLWQNPSGIFAVPTAYLQQFSGLPCHLLGLKVAEKQGDEWTPAHDWVTRFPAEFRGSRVEIPAELLLRWLHGDDLEISSPEKGVVILFDPDGRCLGRGRIMGGKIRNILPRRWIQTG